jgi:hypothetical protein
MHAGLFFFIKMEQYTKYMKSIKGILLSVVIIAVIDAAILTIMRVMGNMAQERYVELMGKSLLVLAVIAIAGLIIAAITSFSSRI